LPAGRPPVRRGGPGPSFPRLPLSTARGRLVAQPGHSMGAPAPAAPAAAGETRGARWRCVNIGCKFGYAVPSADTDDAAVTVACRDHGPDWPRPTRPSGEGRRGWLDTTRPGLQLAGWPSSCPRTTSVRNLETMAARVRSAVPDADLLVVDDNSPDGTGELADKLAAEDSHVRVLHRPGKGGSRRGVPGRIQLGAGAGLWRGSWRWTRTAPTSPSSCLSCWTRSGRPMWCSAPAGCRGGRVLNWPKSREVLSPRGEHLRAADARHPRSRTPQEGTGSTGPARCGPSGSARIESQGYCFQVDLALRALKLGALRVVEGADHVSWSGSTVSSKMSKSIMVGGVLADRSLGGWRPAGRRCAGPARPRAEPAGPGRGSTLPGGAFPGRTARRPGKDPGRQRAISGALAVPCVVLARRFPHPRLAPDQGQPFREHFLQVGDGAALPQHVPVAARRLGLPRCGQVTSGRECGSLRIPGTPRWPEPQPRRQTGR